MNQVPHVTITKEHVRKTTIAPPNWDEYIASISNKAIEIALAEQVNEQPEHTAPHAELKAMYEQQVKDGTLDDFVWLVREGKNWTHRDKINNFYEHLEYSCTPKPTCQIRNLDTGELKTMTREAAKLLQAETIETHDWFFDNGVKGDGRIFGFDTRHTENPYTYKLKAKPLKQVSWKDVPVGVMTNKGELRAFSSGLVWCETKKECPSLAGYSPSQLELAPASRQPWIAVQASETGDCIMVWLSENGFEVDTHVSLQKYRITGLAEGWVLK